MQLTLKIKLEPTKDQKSLIEHTMAEYIATVNDLAQLMVAENSQLKLSSKDVVANLPSSLQNQCILDAKSILKRYKKLVNQQISGTRSILQSHLKQPIALYFVNL